PAGRISFSGLSSQSFFLRDFLDDLGIYPDLLHIGRYKSASDMLTRSNMSEAHREAATHLLQSMQDELTRGVSSGMGLEPAALRTIMDSGHYSGTRAVEAGMVDGVCFSDQVEEEVKELLGRGVDAVDIQDYRNSLYTEDVWGMREKIAVVTASGYIETGSSGASFPMGRVMGSETICRALREAASTPGVRAVVLRIDSPGGSALASADMHHAVQEVRESIPVVVSMGGVAASGGYYMACGADSIFADRLTVTGSIGIISGKFSFGGTLDSLGINVEEISTGPMAGMQSPFRKYTDEERERAYLLMRDGYELFVETVAEGRGMTFQQVDSIGRGRVWTGSSALELGLVDRCGGVVAAVNCAAGLAGISADGPPDVIIFPSPPFPGSLSFPGFGVSQQLIDLLGSEDVLYLMQPFNVR
ncbi:MAG: signal peptide peptidase SppA, partial [Candidatus Aegiribacteria sp.]|nr:signal peptide peptidase SppA [Candidatus Aegiribacteria sp.]MBD3294079.1 signal peptide peptidase SppA [Candidatus Fermentibacteria bacterium]